MIIRRSHAAVVLLTLNLGAWQMGDVFVGCPVSRTNFPRCRLRVKAMPMDNEKPLELGALVGYELDVPGKFFHAGIYLGLGNSQLEEATGRRLNPEMHYVIEYSGPTRFSGAPQSSQVGKVSSGKGGQNIWITPMEPSTEWCVIEIHSDEYGEPHSGKETRRRALSKVGTSFGGYDAFRNNCQHFAVWARYGKKNMILGTQENEQLRITLAAWQLLQLVELSAVHRWSSVRGFSVRLTF
eukprot:Skav222212  [mRNA]  locus=scaffold552:83019:83735:+ [translate_table: standard]